MGEEKRKFRIYKGADEGDYNAPELGLNDWVLVSPDSYKCWHGTHAECVSCMINVLRTFPHFSQV